MNFTQSAEFVAEHCWDNGGFTKQTAPSSTHPLIQSSAKWLLNAWVYFIIKALLLQLPHVMWKSRYGPIIKALTQSCEDLMKQLAQHWLKFSESADEAYRKKLELAADSIDKDVSYQTAMAMTRDVIYITRRQLPLCAEIYNFNQIRWTYQVLALSIFTILDCILLLSCSEYWPSDFICSLPNTEIVRCIVPHVTILWYALFLSCICIVLALLILCVYQLWLLCYIRSRSINGTFLERLPLAESIVTPPWARCRDRHSYRFLCILLLQNPCVLQPLEFTRALVAQLHDDGKTYINHKKAPISIESHKQMHFLSPEDYDSDDRAQQMKTYKQYERLDSDIANDKAATRKATVSSLRAQKKMMSRPKSSSRELIWEEQRDSAI